ncbi:glutathione S-transferase [Terasakiella sp. SH-1]|uniref:glutathione S-transferase n=1 Tax=Terasakiella sp. SH-1 TaxID=2560057 RepID=UPI0010737EDE|nr:glutathione S-transferase [Terasakiella sp. SH-1]
MTDPILYSFRRCPYAMRARMALYASGLSIELREVVLREKPKAMLDISPKGTVPVLQLADGRVIDESRDIMRWALGQHDPEGWLQGDQIVVDNLLDRNDGVFKDYLDGYKYYARYEDVDPLEQRAKAEVILADLNSRLEAAPFLGGQQVNMADYGIFPFIRQFAFVDIHWFRQSPYSALVAWFEQFLENETFKQVMKKHRQWQEGDTPVFLKEG